MNDQEIIRFMRGGEATHIPKSPDPVMRPHRNRLLTSTAVLVRVNGPDGSFRCVGLVDHQARLHLRPARRALVKRGLARPSAEDDAGRA